MATSSLYGFVVIGGPEARGPERLVHLVGALEERVGHAVIVDEIAQRLADLRILQVLILLVEADIVEQRLRHRRDLDVLVAPDGRDLVGGQVLGDVDVALFEREALCRRVLDVRG